MSRSTSYYGLSWSEQRKRQPSGKRMAGASRNRTRLESQAKAVTKHAICVPQSLVQSYSRDLRTTRAKMCRIAVSTFATTALRHTPSARRSSRKSVRLTRGEPPFRHLANPSLTASLMRRAPCSLATTVSREWKPVSVSFPRREASAVPLYADFLADRSDRLETTRKKRQPFTQGERLAL